MATFESVQSATLNGLGNLVITKPVDLAVGDWLVAGVWVSNDGSNTITVNTPSGWTLEEYVSISSNASGLAVFTKIADADDVAASNFSFTTTGGASSGHSIGHLLRISSAGIKDGEAFLAGVTGSFASRTFTGYTPTLPNNLLILFSGLDSSTSQYTTTGYAVATSNPTWTERAETSFNDTTRDSALGVATATRPETTATGDVTVTYNSTVDAGRYAAILIALAPRVDGSTTVVTGNTYIVNHPFLRNGVTEINGENPQTLKRNKTLWQNENKPSTSWTNESL